MSRRRSGEIHRRLHALAARDGGWWCAYCGLPLICECCWAWLYRTAWAGWRNLFPSDDRLATSDHVLAVARGGSDHLINLVLACRHCNTTKHSRTLATWRHAMRRRFRGVGITVGGAT
jgi:5-methylcytosine-specific restriction endonuclease McrA